MLTQFYAPIIGGEEQLIQDLSAALASRGHQVTVATQWHPARPASEVEHGVRIYRLHSLTQRASWVFKDPVRQHAPPWPDPEAVWTLEGVLAREQPDIVHGHNWLARSFLPLRARSQARFVMTLHDYSLACATQRLIYQEAPCAGPGLAKCLNCAASHYGALKGLPTTLANWALAPLERAAVDLFLPVSQAVAEGNGLPGGRTPYQVIPNFIPDEALSADMEDVSRYTARLPAGDFLLFVGDLSRDKGLDVLLRAYAGLGPTHPLVLIGRHCADTPSALPSNVSALGSWPHAAVMAAWRRCQLALVPSVWPEPFGLVALEAMQAGRPVIASRTGGLADIVVDGETGMLVPPGDAAALQAAMARLLAAPELRQRMGQAGQKRLDNFRANVVVPQLEQAYRALMAGEYASHRPLSGSGERPLGQAGDGAARGN